jgi:hypothetical protein
MLRDSHQQREGDRQRAANKKSLFGRAWGGVKWFGVTPIRAFPKDEVVDGGRLIGTLIGAARQDPRSDTRLRLNEDRSFDLEATAFLHGMSVRQIEAVLRRRQRQTVLAAYISFGFGWAFFITWLIVAAMTSWSSWRIVPVLEFAPFCLFLFLIAFRTALQNYQIRTRRMATAWEYLGTPEDFWPH